MRESCYHSLSAQSEHPEQKANTMSDTAVAAPVTEIPAFRDANGNLNSLKPKDFPKTREGKQAHFAYKAEMFRELSKEFDLKAQGIEKAGDPAFQRERKIERMRKLLAKLEAEAANT